MIFNQYHIVFAHFAISLEIYHLQMKRTRTIINVMNYERKTNAHKNECSKTRENKQTNNKILRVTGGR